MAALSLGVALSPARAASGYDLTTLVFFGDSLTDEGRNGRTAPVMWSQVLRNDLSITSGTNYAIGGAITSNQPTTAFGDASYLGQINRFVSAGGSTNAKTGAGIWIGTNNIWIGASNHLSATSVATSAAADVQTGITQLRSSGVSTIIVLGVYDLSLTNAYKSAGTDSASVRSSAAVSSQFYNTLLQQISTSNSNIVYFNIANFINFLQQNASAYGFTRVLPLLPGQSCDSTCQQTSIFTDTIHLTSRAQQLIGDYVASGNPIYNSANFTYGAIAANVISAQASAPMQSYLARAAAADLIRWNFTRLNRLPEGGDDRRSLWAMFGSVNASTDTIRNSGLSINGTQSIVGLTAGVDYQASSAVHVGSLVNYAHSEADVTSSVSSLTKLDAFQFAGYGTLTTPYVRAGSVCLNSLRAFVKWITASIMPPPELAATL
jgi:phospholipase/lecithinase/hemolysin